MKFTFSSLTLALASRALAEETADAFVQYQSTSPKAAPLTVSSFTPSNSAPGAYYSKYQSSIISSVRSKGNSSCEKCSLTTYSDAADYMKPVGAAAVAIGLAAVLI